MLTIPNMLVKFGELIWPRIKIYILFYLALEFGRMFISVGAKPHPYMALWCGVFFDATIIVILNLLYGATAVGRDINTVNCYGLLLHFVFMAFYYQGIDISTYHNYVAMCGNGLITLRLFYLADCDLLSRIAVIEYAKNWHLDRRWFFNSYINALTITLFFLCAIPLCTLIYLINTDQMRLTGIAIILFSFFVAIEYSTKNTPRRAGQIGREIATPLRPENGNMVAMRSMVATAPDLPTEHARASKKELDYWSLCMLCGAIFVFLIYVIGSILLRQEKSMMFKFGYASGYNDGKQGEKAKSETHWDKLMECYRTADPYDMPFGKVIPPPGTKSPCIDD